MVFNISTLLANGVPRHVLDMYVTVHQVGTGKLHTDSYCRQLKGEAEVRVNALALSESTVCGVCARAPLPEGTDLRILLDLAMTVGAGHRALLSPEALDGVALRQVRRNLLSRVAGLPPSWAAQRQEALRVAAAVGTQLEQRQTAPVAAGTWLDATLFLLDERQELVGLSDTVEVLNSALARMGKGPTTGWAVKLAVASHLLTGACWTDAPAGLVRQLVGCAAAGTDHDALSVLAGAARAAVNQLHAVTGHREGLQSANPPAPDVLLFVSGSSVLGGADALDPVWALVLSPARPLVDTVDDDGLLRWVGVVPSLVATWLRGANRWPPSWLSMSTVPLTNPVTAEVADLASRISARQGVTAEAAMTAAVGIALPAS